MYDLRSGDTHSIAYPSGHVLSALHEAASDGMPLGGLHERLACAGRTADPGRLAEVIEALCELGIVEDAAADCPS